MIIRLLFLIAQIVCIALHYFDIVQMAMWQYLMPLIIYFALNVALALAVLYSERP